MKPCKERTQYKTHLCAGDSKRCECIACNQCDKANGISPIEAGCINPMGRKHYNDPWCDGCKLERCINYHGPSIRQEASK